MILGAGRVPFSRPAGANANFQPGLPATGHYSHFHPLTMVTQAMPAVSAYRPPYPGAMGPTPLPAVPVPQPAAPVVAPSAGGMSGAFGGSGFGSTGGVRSHLHIDPYNVMRSGGIPGVRQNGSNLRAGIRNAGARVRAGMPFQTAALPPPPPPPPPPAAAAPATGLKGFMGALFGAPRRRRRTAWWMPQADPNPYAGMAVCETITDSYGLRKTICGGRVTRIEDAEGNVRIPGQLPPGFSGASWRQAQRARAVVTRRRPGGFWR